MCQEIKLFILIKIHNFAQDNQINSEILRKNKVKPRIQTPGLDFICC